MKVENEATQQTPDTNDKKSSCNKSFPSLATCWGILLLIMVLRFYFSTVLEKRIANLTEETQMLKKKNEELENLTGDSTLLEYQTKLTLQMNNLTQVITVLEKNVTNLTKENQNLRGKNEELETEKKNLTEIIQQMTTQWNELNVSRAQWSIDAYCPKINNNRVCKICQAGLLSFQSGCYAINDPQASEQKTWKGARDDCIGKISDLAVVNNETEKSYISDNSWGSSGNNGYWIGLRVEDGNWKWADGRNLTNSVWIPGSPLDGQCAISVINQGFKSVSCTAKNRWICKKKALTL